jgi:hypothetical protein
MTRRSHRRRLASDLQARILPDVSTRQPAEPSKMSAEIEAYRQTPEAWREVWAEK